MLQIFIKEGVLMKLSRKVMQPRMFFLVEYTANSFVFLLFVSSTVNIHMTVAFCLNKLHNQSKMKSFVVKIQQNI